MKIEYDFAGPDHKNEKAHTFSNLSLILIIVATWILGIGILLLELTDLELLLVLFIISISSIILVLFFATIEYAGEGVVDYTPITVFSDAICLFTGHGLKGWFRPKMMIIPFYMIDKIIVKKGSTENGSADVDGKPRYSIKWEIEMRFSDGTKIITRRPARTVIEAIEAIEVMTSNGHGPIKQVRFPILPKSVHNKASANYYLAMSLACFLFFSLSILFIFPMSIDNDVMAPIATLAGSFILFWAGSKLWKIQSMTPEFVRLDPSWITLVSKNSNLEYISWDALIAIGIRSSSSMPKINIQTETRLITKKGGFNVSIEVAESIRKAHFDLFGFYPPSYYGDIDLPRKMIKKMISAHEKMNK